MIGNHHFGNVGDVWKHLLTCAILDEERPDRFWETHAGAARYAMDEADERQFGAGRYLARSRDVPALDSATYTTLFSEANDSRTDPETYLGSPALAMGVLGDAADYYFFDVDPGCLDSIREEASRRDCSSAVNAVPADGLSGVAAGIAADGDGTDVVHVDPFETFAATDPAGLTPIELFADVAARGDVALLWYGFESAEAIERRWEHVREEVREQLDDASSAWCGELALEAPANHGLSTDPGLVGSHLLCAGLSPETEQRCRELGDAIAAAYDHGDFPGDQRGGLSFTVRTP
ncbi:hypothetical protein BRC81_02070 [Halobacteriales archaeon QS_1_68_20]|nr:MAG: hypothetical protein BRC81_02070 [Halobacteriales archaeon QS_1_68_20]